MSNSKNGLDALRHSYVLLFALGLRESSGRHCVGRYKKQNFDRANSAEAGLFQTSWGAHTSNNALSELYERYKSDQHQCLLDVFSENINCSDPWDAKTWGTGTGADWQKLTKSCPAFATEYGAVVLRANGGRTGEFGPIRERKVRLLAECDSMFAEVQSLAKTDPEVCAALK